MFLVDMFACLSLNDAILNLMFFLFILFLFVCLFFFFLQISAGAFMFINIRLKYAISKMIIAFLKFHMSIY